MVFWGWGRKSINTKVSPEQAVVLAYRYFHLMFVFSVAFGYSYAVASWTPQGWATRPVTEQEARHLLGGEQLRPHPWWRFSLPAAIVAIALVGVITRLVK